MAAYVRRVLFLFSIFTYLTFAVINPVVAPPPPAFSLAKTPECSEDIATLCPQSQGGHNNNFDVLECLQQQLMTGKQVAETCQSFIWEYKRNLTKDDRFEIAGSEVCQHEFQLMPDCTILPAGIGKRIPCMLENIGNIPLEAQSPKCQKFLTRMGAIIFSDYHFLWNFMEKCQEDIISTKCGRLDPVKDLHQQGRTMMCLASKISDLHGKCKKQVLRVAELQSDDYHMDRPLFYACREDRETFCAKVHSGDGKVFDCLFKHKQEETMSKKCREQLTARQKLIAQDIKVDKTFYTACMPDLKAQKCHMKIDDSIGEETRRSVALLCLENAVKKEKHISRECIGEMNEMRRSLMEDYQITPEVVAGCHEEIQTLCGATLDSAGKTIHCLMEHVNPRKSEDQKLSPVSPQCKAAIEDLLKEADVASDLTIDSVLAEACAPVITTDCSSVKATSMHMINCLMEKIDSEHMTDDCENRLLEIQYFIVRDFTLESELYKECHKDATHLCHAPEDWNTEEQGAELGPMVFQCLYRYSHKKPSGKSLTKGCRSQVRRAMRQRAKRVELDPSIEDKCLLDLADLCSNLENYEPGAEVKCLQEHLEELSDECQEAVGNFTEDEDEDMELDTILMRACTPMISKFCEPLLNQDVDASEVMNCLIEHKNHQDMNSKCAAGVNHHQLISLKDFRFTHKFKEACKNSVLNFCKDKTKKSEVVVCLSELVRDDVLKEEKHRVDRDCRRQLRVEILQREQTIDLDPRLKEMCQNDISLLCTEVKQEDSEVVECLKEKQSKLSVNCHKLIFKRERVEVAMGIDYNLKVACKSMIQSYCSEEETDILDCLKRNKHRRMFDPTCRAYVVRRMIQENKDYRLNPSLMKSCAMDIPKFCHDIVEKQEEDTELEGKVVDCLKQQYVNKRLSRSCEEEIQGLIRETNEDVRLDPILMKTCRPEMHTHCAKELTIKENSSNKLKFQPDSFTGDVIECLKGKVFDGTIKKDTACGKEIARLALEGEIDIHVDPVLAEACQADILHWCQELDVGDGRHMSCLLSVMEDHPKQMKPKCFTLLKQRKTLWEYAAKPAPPEGFADLSEQIRSSPSKVYFLGVLISIIGLIFVFGITCGRVTKRVTAAQKNK